MNVRMARVETEEERREREREREEGEESENSLTTDYGSLEGHSENEAEYESLRDE